MKLGNRYLKNIIWLAFDVFIKFFLTFGMSVLIARYMGVEDFGLYSYLLSIFAICILVSALGMNGIIVKELVHQSNHNEILGSALFLQRVGAFLISIFLVIWAVFFSENKPDDFLWIFFLILPTIFLQSSNIYRYWFEFKVLSKYSVISQDLSLLIGAILKVAVIYFEYSYFYILALTLVEQLIFVRMLKYFFKKNNYDYKLAINKDTCFDLLSRSWPLIISGLAFVLYIKIDQIMIGELLGMKQLGIFSVAVKLIESCFFIPTILVSTFFPVLVKISTNSEGLYNHKMQLLYDVTVLIGIFIFFFNLIFAEYIIFYSFGEDYIGAVDQLKIYSLVCIFYFLSVVSGRWYINAGLQKIAIFRNIVGLIVAVVLNFILIPGMGLTGASVSTVIAYIFSSYIFDFFDKRTRVVFYQKTRSLWVFGSVKRIFVEYIK